VILLENVRVDQFVLLSRLEMHAILVAERSLHVLEMLIQKDVLEHANCVIKVVIFFVLAWKDS